MRKLDPFKSGSVNWGEQRCFEGPTSWSIKVIQADVIGSNSRNMEALLYFKKQPQLPNVKTPVWKIHPLI